MMKTNNYNVLTKREETYLTPPELIEELQRAKHYIFNLDPACPQNMPWRTAETMLTKTEDGLAREWHGHVWLNPPYGKETAKWMQRLAEHNDGIALVFARTDAQWFHDFVLKKAAAIYLLKGRIRFYNTDGSRTRDSAPAPSVLVAYGEESAYALAIFACHQKFPGRFIAL